LLTNNSQNNIAHKSTENVIARTILQDISNIVQRCNIIICSFVVDINCISEKYNSSQLIARLNHVAKRE